MGNWHFWLLLDEDLRWMIGDDDCSEVRGAEEGRIGDASRLGSKIGKKKEID